MVSVIVPPDSPPLGCCALVDLVEVQVVGVVDKHVVVARDVVVVVEELVVCAVESLVDDLPQVVSQDADLLDDVFVGGAIELVEELRVVAWVEDGLVYAVVLVQT